MVVDFQSIDIACNGSQSSYEIGIGPNHTDAVVCNAGNRQRCGDISLGGNVCPEEISPIRLWKNTSEVLQSLSHHTGFVHLREGEHSLQSQQEQRMFLS